MLRPRDPERIDRIINKLKQLWKSKPDSRLLQLINDDITHSMKTPYLVEDNVVEAIIDQMLKEE